MNHMCCYRKWSCLESVELSVREWRTVAVCVHVEGEVCVCVCEV